MIDIRNLKYRITLVRETGEKLLLNDITTDLQWGDYDKEIAARGSLTVANIVYNGEPMTSIIKMNTKFIIEVDWGQGFDEVFRGSTFRKTYNRQNVKAIQLMLYDDIYYLQRSKEQRYITDGTACNTAIDAILSSWGVPNVNNAPTNAMLKRMFRSDTIADEIYSLLDEAHSKGSEDYNVRSIKGSVIIDENGINAEIPVIDITNTEGVQDEQNIENIVTRVRIMLNITKDEEASPQQAVLENNIQFGTFQDIQYMQSTGSLEDAKATAQATLDANSVVHQYIMIPSVVDVPWLRRGDIVKVVTDAITGYYNVLTVQHNASRRTMNLEVVPYDRWILKARKRSLHSRQ